MNVNKTIKRNDQTLMICTTSTVGKFHTVNFQEWKLVRLDVKFRFWKLFPKYIGRW